MFLIEIGITALLAAALICLAWSTFFQATRKHKIAGVATIVVMAPVFVQSVAILVDNL